MEYPDHFSVSSNRCHDVPELQKDCEGLLFYVDVELYTHVVSRRSLIRCATYEAKITLPLLLLGTEMTTSQNRHLFSIHPCLKPHNL